MLQIYYKKIEKVWFAIAIKNSTLYATTFNFTERGVLQNILRNIPYDIPFRVEEKVNEKAEKILEILRTIYDGKDSNLNINFDISWLTKYSKNILEATSKIPVGYVTSYGLLAKTMGGSPRAVGRVMATNPLPLVIPCHRVVKTDFTLGGYGGGIQLKWEILQKENRGYKQPKTIKINNHKTLQVFPVQQVKNLQ